MRAAAVAALVVTLTAGSACAADDEFSTPTPTVPVVTTVTPTKNRAEPSDRPGQDPPPADALRADVQKADSDIGGEPADAGGTVASTGDEPAVKEPAVGATGAATDTPEPADHVLPPTTLRPDGDMFAAEVALEHVITLDEPIDMAVAPGDDLVWIAERAGRVLRVDLQRGETVETVLDISSETVAAGERGLLGIAVTDQWLYANFTDLAGDTRVDAFERSGTGLSGGRHTILFQPQPYGNHNGGDLAIGPDGFLYVAFGDGGAGGDPLNAGQDPTTWLGAVLRINPTPGAAQPYTVPADNPFVAANQAARPEIFLTGVRNPWRFSFDRASGDLWIADVGQDAYEEVTVLLAANGGGGGANLGWRLREGLHRFTGDEPPNHADPVWEYSQDDGCSVTGGYVYRGSAIEDLYGAYVFGDYCASRLWALQISTGEVEFRELGAEVFGGSLASFGEDAAGELYALSLNGTVARIVPR